MVDAFDVVNTSLVIVAPGCPVLNDTKGDPSVDPSYLPVVVLNLIMPTSHYGRCAVVPTGIVNPVVPTNS